MEAYRFFVSYARGDMGRDLHLLKFCEMVMTNVRRKIGEKREAYFFDQQDIPPGGLYPDNLAGALRSARSFLAFYSPAYFNSPDCGREIKAFQARGEKYMQANPGLKPCEPLGVLWENATQLESKIPASLSKVQYNVPPHTDPLETVRLRKMVSESGLRFMFEQAEAGSKECELAIVKIVECYANHIQRITEDCDLTPYQFGGEYSDLPYDFPSVMNAAGDSYGPPPPRGPQGPNFIKVIFLVGTASWFAEVQERTFAGCYADDDRFWRPYLPEDENIFGLVARAVIAQKGVIETIRWDSTPTYLALKRVIDETEANNNVLLVVADPWSCFVPELASCFDAVDKEKIVNGAVFLPWNHEDIDTKTNSPLLKQKLEETLWRMADELPRMIFDSPAALDEQLQKKIIELKNRIKARAALRNQLRPLPRGSALPSVAVPTR